MNQATIPEVRRPLEATPPSTEVRSMGDGILAVIARAATDPTVDIDKMERLLEMQERVLARDAKAAYTRAFAAMQSDLPVITERGEIKHNNKVMSTYAKWEDINEVIKPILAEHGFALSFRTRREGDRVMIVGVLSHVEGHSEETEFDLPTDTSGAKNAVQAVGSSTSYGKRYAAQALLNLTSRGEDDDGAKGGARAIDDAQYALVVQLIESTGADTKRFLAKYRIETVNDLPAAKFQDAVDALNAYARDKAAKAQQGQAR